MTTYKFVEDYLELLAGYDPGSSNIFNTSNFNFSLARYDVKIVESMANSTIWSQTALTDKQGDLAVKLVLKYRKQFANFGIDISPVENPQWRMPLRTINRNKNIWIVDQSIRVSFPFNQQLIEQIKKFKDESQGSARWHSDEKYWQFGITEYNVNWLTTWGQANQFDIDQEVINLFSKILECEKDPYEIKLIKTASGYEVTNAAPSLVEYIDEHIGNDVIRLVDHAGVLGYSVEADILQECSEQYGSALEYIGIRHKAHIMPMSDPNMWDWILDYAELTQRYPICIYDPGVVNLDISKFDESEIVRFDHNGKTKTDDYNPHTTKVVYARSIPKTWDFPVPLLVSTVEMMYGGKKLDWLNRAEKIVYWTNTIIKELE